MRTWLSGATGAQRGPRRSDSLFSLSVWKGSTKLAAEEPERACLQSQAEGFRTSNPGMLRG